MSVPQIAFEKGFHLMTSRQMVQAMQEWLQSMPTVPWAELQEGETYVYLRGTNNYECFTVVRTTPTRAKVIAQDLNRDGAETELFKGNYDFRTFWQLDEGLKSMLYIQHEAIVRAAHDQILQQRADDPINLALPLEVRCEYPELYVQVPERFNKGGGHHAEKVFQTSEWDWCRNLSPAREATALDRLKSCLTGRDWPRSGRCTPAKVQQWIDEANRRAGQLTCVMIRGSVEARPGDSLNARQSFDRLLLNFCGDIDFYEWLMPLVSEGGPFYYEVPQSCA